MKNLSKEAARTEFIRENQKKWIETGSMFRKIRESIELTKTATAEKIGISRSTLTRFEQGEPIKNYKIILKSYFGVLENYQLMNSIIELYKNRQMPTNFNTNSNISTNSKIVRATDQSKELSCASTNIRDSEDNDPEEMDLDEWLKERGQDFKKKREELGLSRKDIAFLMNVSLSTIIRFEWGCEFDDEEDYMLQMKYEAVLLGKKF